jgi:hypothetical protein
MLGGATTGKTISIRAYIGKKIFSKTSRSISIKLDATILA